MSLFDTGTDCHSHRQPSQPQNEIVRKYKANINGTGVECWLNLFGHYSVKNTVPSDKNDWKSQRAITFQASDR